MKRACVCVCARFVLCKWLAYSALKREMFARPYDAWLRRVGELASREDREWMGRLASKVDSLSKLDGALRLH